MTGRRVTLGHWFDGAAGERYAELDVYVTAGSPATHYDPACPGTIEPEQLIIDGNKVDIYPAYQWLVDRILEREPIPPPDEMY